MAIDNQLVCNTRMSEEQIREVFDRCGEVSYTHEDGNLHFWRIGMQGAVLPASDLTKELFSEIYGFTPTTDFFFRISRFEDFEVGFDAMTCVCGLLLKIAKDCVLLFGDRAVLLKRGSDLI